MRIPVTIDTGNKRIKGEDITFSAGIIASDTKPPFGGDTLQYKGKFYTLTDERIPYMRDKTTDDRYFILSLFAMAYQFENYPGLDGDDFIEIDLLIGLPPKHYGTLRGKYKSYYQRDEYIEFQFNSKGYCVYIADVYVFPQAFAAVAPVIGEYKAIPKVVIVDIGGYTADLLLLKKGVPDQSVCESLEYGTIKFYNAVRSKVNETFDIRIDESDVDNVLMEQEQEQLLGDDVSALIRDMAGQYINDFFNQLRELEIDLKTAMTVFVGGGTILFREYIDEQTGKMGQYHFIENINANARGYKQLYNASKG